METGHSVGEVQGGQVSPNFSGLSILTKHFKVQQQSRELLCLRAMHKNFIVKEHVPSSALIQKEYLHKFLSVFFIFLKKVLKP